MYMYICMCIYTYIYVYYIYYIYIVYYRHTIIYKHQPILKEEGVAAPNDKNSRVSPRTPRHASTITRREIISMQKAPTTDWITPASFAEEEDLQQPKSVFGCWCQIYILRWWSGAQIKLSSVLNRPELRNWVVRLTSGGSLLCSCASGVFGWREIGRVRVGLKIGPGIRYEG